MNQALLSRLQSDYPNFRFKSGAKFAFRPPSTIIVGPTETRDDLLLLHELGHALSRHQDFTSDVARLKMERQAWTKAHQLAKKYALPWDEDFVEDQLDSYREWLHRRSSCPKCGLTCYQTPDGIYHCPKCENFTKKAA